MANKLNKHFSRHGWSRWISRFLLIVAIPLPLLPPWSLEWGLYPYFAGLLPIGNSFILLIIAVVAWKFPKVGGAIGSSIVILEYLTFYPGNFPGNFTSYKLMISLLLPVILAFGAALSVKAGQKSFGKTVGRYAWFQWPTMALIAVPPIIILILAASFFQNVGWAIYFGFPFLFFAIVIWMTPIIGGIIAIVFSILFSWAYYNIQYSPFSFGIPFLLIGSLLSLSFGIRIYMIIRKDKNAKKQVGQND